MPLNNVYSTDARYDFDFPSSIPLHSAYHWIAFRRIQLRSETSVWQAAREILLAMIRYMPAHHIEAALLAQELTQSLAFPHELTTSALSMPSAIYDTYITDSEDENSDDGTEGVGTLAYQCDPDTYTLWVGFNQAQMQDLSFEDILSMVLKATKAMLRAFLRQFHTGLVQPFRTRDILFEFRRSDLSSSDSESETEYDSDSTNSDNMIYTVQ